MYPRTKKRNEGKIKTQIKANLLIITGEYTLLNMVIKTVFIEANKINGYE